MGKGIVFLLGAVLAFAAPALAQTVATPQLTGPVAAPDVPGTPSHNYPFFFSNHDLAAHGYVEEEYFIKGTAATYDTPDLKTGRITGSHPYETRIVVRRPLDSRRFNGTAIVEWYNVTNNFDAENVWFFDWEDMMRAGYVWVGVSPQHVGTDALKKWSPARYGNIHVTDPAAPTGPDADADAMSYDIFSQAGQALRHPGGVDPLHGLKPRVFLAAGESQSASRLSSYVNSVHPLAHVYDGFLLLSGSRRIRDDLISPVFKLNMEHDVVTGDASVRQADSNLFRSWDVAGTSHVDQHLRASREPLELRDNGLSLEASMAPQCAVPQIGTRVPSTYVVAAAFDHLRRWAAGGAPPPTAPKLEITQVNPRPAQSVVARDKDGLALGGIRLSQLAVPTQINFGLGKPSQAAVDTGIRGEAIGAGACVRWGYSLDMPAEELAARYPSHAAYVAAVKTVTDANLKAGFILKPDADETIRQAQAARIGR